MKQGHRADHTLCSRSTEKQELVLPMNGSRGHFGGGRDFHVPSSSNLLQATSTLFKFGRKIHEWQLQTLKTEFLLHSFTDPSNGSNADTCGQTHGHNIHLAFLTKQDWTA
jgi:hypothetical protein